MTIVPRWFQANDEAAEPLFDRISEYFDATAEKTRWCTAAIDI